MQVIPMISVIAMIMVVSIGISPAYSSSYVPFCDDGSAPIVIKDGLTCNPSKIELLYFWFVDIFELLLQWFDNVGVYSVLPNAYANGFSFSESNFFFKVQNVIEDIRINLASPADKIDLIKEFALDKQTIIDTKTKNGEKVPLDIEERRLALIEKTDNITESVDIITQFKDELNQLGEMNEIRILYSQFEDCKLNCTDQQLQDFNDKVNALDSWNNKCQGTFDIDDYDYTMNSFDKLSSKCPDLYKFSKNHLRVAVNGD